MLASTGAYVFYPVGHCPDYDLVADLDDGRLIRVQVKTSTYCRNGRFEVAVSTYGGNRSWDGLVKRFDCFCCDYLFVHVGDGRRWFIPAGRVEAGCRLLLGGPKYAKFEIKPAEPLQAHPKATQ